MPTDAEQIATIKSQALANLVAITATPKPSYDIDGQEVSWTEYHDMLQKQVAWADTQLAGETPLEQHTVGFVP
jgi:hypothetical protein